MGGEGIAAKVFRRNEREIRSSAVRVNAETVYSGRCEAAVVMTSPQKFSPLSVQFKGEISDVVPRKRHQKRHLDYRTPYLLSRMLWVRIPPGAPPPFPFNDLCVK